jgi:acyl-coenzyme A synthetase/AMP-(fatty) acid ligase
VGRRDHQVKVRGHRIELGAIETALLSSDEIADVAVVVRGEGISARLCACVVPSGEKPPSLLFLKALCAARLPRYMIVDEVVHLAELPRTRNGKLDRQALAREGEPGE